MKISSMNIFDLEIIKDKLDDFDDFWNYNILKSELENENSKYIVAKINDEIVGFGGIWLAPFEIHITNIVVRKDKRNNGIGTKLMNEILNMAKKENLKEITLEVNSNNLSAIKLYEKFDFKKVGMRKRYYNNTDDAIIMTRNI